MKSAKDLYIELCSQEEVSGDEEEALLALIEEQEEKEEARAILQREIWEETQAEKEGEV